MTKPILELRWLAPLDPDPDCPICWGTGFVGQPVTWDDGVEDRVIGRCECNGRRVPDAMRRFR